MMDDRTVICRCEDVTYGEIRRAMAEGADCLDEVKKRTRAGMGCCQGTSCAGLLEKMVGGEPSGRPPARPVSLGELASAADDGDKP